MAKLKELKDQILLAVYHHFKDGTFSAVHAQVFCNQNDIVFDSTQELALAVKGLHEHGYLNITFFIGSSIGWIQGITPAGVGYVEEHLLSDDERLADALKDTDKQIKSGAVIDDGTEVNSSSTTDISQSDADTPSDEEAQRLYKTITNFRNIVDLNTSPCFGVNALADCFIKQMDKIASHDNENFRMLGIFAPWGRGKTYFFNKIKEKLSSRGDNIKYKIVEFNAWKYQDTPAIWAYLYEGLYEQTCWYQKVRLWWNRLQSSLPSFGNIAIFLLVVLAAWLLYYFMYKCLVKEPNIRAILQEIQFPIIWVSLAFGVIYNFIKNPVPTYKYIIKHSRRKSYRSYLGIQNDLEKDLEVLLTKMITKPQEEQLLLYVDDIDRCSTDKMLEVINSLRIILENTEIQKRLIVICSIDPEKLINGYCIQKAKGINKTDFIIEEAREHIDKLFIFGIGLAPLDISQCQEYLQTIAEVQKTQSESNRATPPYSEGKQNKSFVVTNGTEDVPELTETEICDFMNSFILNHENIEFTPRKLRIMYYRLLFANNLIAIGGGNMPASIMDEILTKSIYPNTKIDNTIAYADIVNTVVPY